MKSRPRLIQAVALILAGSLLAVCRILQGHADRQSQACQLVPAGDTTNRNYPDATLWGLLPGGLRAPFVSYQWARAQEMMQEGQYFDALQRAEWICALQPTFPGVWDFQSWNVTYNISVAAHTPQERWRWVSAGITLLRDKGIPMNPRSVRLYWAMGWIYYHKMAGMTDEMNLVYKKRWAWTMQQVLGAPPAGELDEVIAAFRPIATAPLDKAAQPDPDNPIQPKQRDLLLADASVAAYAAKLAAKGIGADRSLLDAYNRYSNEDAAASVRFRPVQLATPQDRDISAVINDDGAKVARGKLLAFVRAQILYNQFRLDPAYMLGLMEKYGAPLDWRCALPHGLYWVSYGVDKCGAEKEGNFNAVNTERLILFCLKDMTWYGRLNYIENPDFPDDPQITPTADLRYIWATHRQYIRLGEAVAKAKGTDFENNIFRDGHKNFLIASIQMLDPANRHKDAEGLIDYIDKNYHWEGPEWGRWHTNRDVRAFVNFSINHEGKPTANLTMSQVTVGLQTGMVALAGGGAADIQLFKDMFERAKFFHATYQSYATERMNLPELEQIAAVVLQNILIEPRAIGYNLPLSARAQLYETMLRAAPSLDLMVYDSISPYLREQCKDQGLDFDKAFPAPPGLKEYRARTNYVPEPIIR